MPNISEPRLAAHIDRCWDRYRRGLIAETVSLIAPARELLHSEAPDLDERSRGNAETELAMLGVIAAMVTGQSADECIGLSQALAERAAKAELTCDALHRVAAFAVGVHAAMRCARVGIAERRFQEVLGIAQGLVAEGGEPGVSIDDVSTVVGCAGLHLAGAAAAAQVDEMALSLLDHSALTAAELGREHDVMGQYFGPQHVAAMRSIALAQLNRFDEAIHAGHQVDTDALIPLVRATLLRTMSEAAERLERPAKAARLAAEADAAAPPIRRQFEPGPAEGP